jgi:hypothetical protein
VTTTTVNVTTTTTGCATEDGPYNWVQSSCPPPPPN